LNRYTRGQIAERVVQDIQEGACARLVANAQAAQQ
jgi:hypothetical protein